MDSFNKIISFILGLVVVLVFFSIVTGKIKFPAVPTIPTNPPTCDYYNLNTTVSDLPVRCLNYYLNK